MKEVEISLKSQSANVVLKEKTPLNLSALRSSVEKADYKAGDIRMAAKGEVRKRPEKRDWILKIPDLEQVFLLRPVEAENDSSHVYADLLVSLEGGQSRFSVSGLVRASAGNRAVLEVEAFRALGPGAER